VQTGRRRFSRQCEMYTAGGRRSICVSNSGPEEIADLRAGLPGRLAIRGDPTRAGLGRPLRLLGAHGRGIPPSAEINLLDEVIARMGDLISNENNH
jgi:hypothetical protein